MYMHGAVTVCHRRTAHKHEAFGIFKFGPKVQSHCEAFKMIGLSILHGMQKCNRRDTESAEADAEKFKCED